MASKKNGTPGEDKDGILHHDLIGVDISLEHVMFTFIFEDSCALYSKTVTLPTLATFPETVPTFVSCQGTGGDSKHGVGLALSPLEVNLV